MLLLLDIVYGLIA